MCALEHNYDRYFSTQREFCNDSNEKRKPLWNAGEWMFSITLLSRHLLVLFFQISVNSSKKYLELYSIYLPRESQFSGQRRNCREPSRSSLSASSLYHPQSMPCCAPGRLCRHKKITSVHYSWLKRKEDRQREKEKKRRGNQSGGVFRVAHFPYHDKASVWLGATITENRHR